MTRKVEEKSNIFRECQLVTTEKFEEIEFGIYTSEAERCLASWKSNRKMFMDDSESFRKERHGCIAETKFQISSLMLTTDEPFPNKFSVDKLGSENEGKFWPDLLYNDSVLINGNKSSASFPKQNNNVPIFASNGKKRKSIVFSSPFSANGFASRKREKFLSERSIMESIPSNASTIVQVMGRKINMEQLCSDNSSVYSMLRSWVKGDPGNKSMKGTVKKNRKSIMEYASMNTLSETQKENRAITPKRTEENNAIKKKNLGTEPFDLIKWLDTDQYLRTNIPYYPDLKEARDAVEKKKKRKLAIKVVRNRAIKRLWRKGVFC